MTQQQFRELVNRYGLHIEAQKEILCVEYENGHSVSIEDLTEAQFCELLGV